MRMPRLGLHARAGEPGYSGYVHAASPHIMEMYGGNPARFHVRGMHGTPRQDEHRDDFCHAIDSGFAPMNRGALNQSR